ncbi:glutamine amidotransferase [Halobacillus andaensis]|uniref:Glutamine amidotransferase n=1 Tax=Halobacillus andaensis TaxID=1176239 RepID=A0A917EW43_HALAA|nr:aminodeoxychorismate/anthranilate synthase component II [Halobacillus andaensis]MBP2004591.1 anthranilate synthase component 2/para-aminobenzoate synthetase component 2 [Halobacillus andaensis]GGF20483.1 glutamine amidotransferase [Halobacillus andaensis]
MIVIIDNYDSFTYNLVQYFKQLESDVVVFRNDEVTLAQLILQKPTLLVLSPGPGRPDETGVCRKVLQHFAGSVPILGVCLGHQLIVEHFGGRTEEGVQPMHGKVTKITHDGRTVFQKLATPVQVARYHSLHTPLEDMPICLEISAMSEDSVVMAVRHHLHPIEGLQFHPEAILTERGFEMLENFYNHAVEFMNQKTKGTSV